MTKSRIAMVALAVFALIAAGCGSDDDTAESTQPETVEESVTTTEPQDGQPEEDGSESDDAGVSPGFPVTIESAGGSWTLESAPQRIVSLSPTATEILFAVGAGDQVIAVDSFSYFPAEAPVTDLSGWDPNVEAITAFEPDLVIIANDANDLVASLTEVNIPVLVSAAPPDIDGGYATMAEIGVATGHIDETAEVVANLRAEIAEALEAAPEASVRIYHELDDTFFSASSFGFVGAVYKEMGATNIADEADTDGFGFPQLTEEYIVEADPEVIVITDQVTYTAEDVAARPGWEEITAVKNGNIVVVNADIASRWGPRLPQFIAAVAEALATVEAAS